MKKRELPSQKKYKGGGIRFTQYEFDKMETFTNGSFFSKEFNRTYRRYNQNPIRQ